MGQPDCGHRLGRVSEGWRKVLLSGGLALAWERRCLTTWLCYFGAIRRGLPVVRVDEVQDVERGGLGGASPGTRNEGDAGRENVSLLG